jgi:ElaB/YqjD/DUF883 family membrane-anchored ribosome-binding protein
VLEHAGCAASARTDKASAIAHGALQRTRLASNNSGFDAATGGTVPACDSHYVESSLIVHIFFGQEIIMNKQGMADAGSSVGSQTVDEKVESIKDAVKGLVDQGAQKVDAIKAKVVEAKDQAFSRGGDILDRATDVIKAHPIKSVAIAFAAGYIGMRLFR